MAREGNGVAVRPAAEAVEEPLAVVDCERRGFILMKRAAADVFAEMTSLQLDVLSYQLEQSDTIADHVENRVGDTA